VKYAKRMESKQKKVAKFLEKYFTGTNALPASMKSQREPASGNEASRLFCRDWRRSGIWNSRPESVGDKARRIASCADSVAWRGSGGHPPLSQEAGIEYLELQKKFVPFDDPVALRIDGYSMRDAGILPGESSSSKTSSMQ